RDPIVADEIGDRAHRRRQSFTVAPDCEQLRTGACRSLATGGVPERPNGTVLKTVEAQASVGSNPTPSARCQIHNVLAGQRAERVSGLWESERISFEPCSKPREGGDPDRARSPSQSAVANRVFASPAVVTTRV